METSIPAAKRQRTYGPRVANPAVRFGELEGEPVAYVQLSGYGHDRAMILSADRWPEVAAKWGRKWLLQRYGSSERVVGTSVALSQVTGNRQSFLSRLLMGAAAGQLVTHRNGNTLDLRDSNLQVVAKRRPKAPKQPKPPKPLQPRALSPKTNKAVHITPLATLALFSVRILLGAKEGRRITERAAVEYALCEAADALGEAAKVARQGSTAASLD